jgi:hypothetical protein
MEFAIEVPLLIQQHSATTLDQSVPPAHVKVLHWLLLAQGSRRPRLQLLITYGPIVGALVYAAVAFMVPWRSFFAVEVIVNAFFCNEFCQHNQLQRLIAWAIAHQSENSTSPAKSLQKVAWVGLAACIFFAVSYAATNFDWNWNNMLKSSWWLNVAFTLSGCFATSLIFYLCFLWFWMNWILHTTAQHWVQHRLDADSVLGVGGRDAGKELWEILGQMKAVSSVWGKNHAVRLVTSIGLAATLLMEAEYELHSSCNNADDDCSKVGTALGFGFAALLYTLVWLTAAVPGYINDMLFSNIHRKLYTMCPEPDTDPADGQLPPTSVLPVLTRHQRQSHPLTALEAKTTALMHRAHYLQGREGMHFAFVPMSLARAVTVGTVLGYTVVFATRTAKQFD